MSDGKIRIDKWLWAARFFKTRNLATEAVSGGKVHLNDSRVKPSRVLASGDRLRIRKGELEFRVEVLGLSESRGSASEAEKLYREEPDSIAAREARRDERRLQHSAAPQPHGRPDKKARREWRRLTGK